MKSTKIRFWLTGVFGIFYGATSFLDECVGNPADLPKRNSLTLKEKLERVARARALAEIAVCYSLAMLSGGAIALIAGPASANVWVMAVLSAAFGMLVQATATLWILRGVKMP